MTDSITNHDLPLGVEVRHLAALEAIARTSSFSQAATYLGYAQSAVSQQIATLEKAVGHKLVERPGGPRPVSLTAAGEVLLRHATHITARLGAAKADLDALSAGEAGSLRVGTFQSASARLLPPTVVRFRDNWPRITVDLRNEQNAMVLEELLRAGQLDVAFSDTGAQVSPLTSTELIEDPYVVMLPPDNPLALLDEIDLGSLDGIRLISGSSEDTTCEARVFSALERAGVQTQKVFRSDDNLTTQRLVAAGLGIAIVPLLAVELFVPDAAVTVLPILERQRIIRRISIVWHQDRYRSRAAEAFVETAVAVARSIGLPHVPVVTSRQGAATLLV
jgi:DNA-binding transcriptional LysR family regulator